MRSESAPGVSPSLAAAWQVADRLRRRLNAAVVGRESVVDQIVIATLAGGHVLLEDYPGSGKTTLAKALGASIVDDGPEDGIAAMRRIQFTPDLLPSDVTGTTIFDPDNQRFFFRPGPIFAHVVLADEINRTSPKVQSALLEAMAEGQVTVDNQTRPLDALFFVIATQNPLDLAGTFPLPAAQLDRFLFKIRMVPIDRAAELDLLLRLDEVRRGPAPELAGVTRTEVVNARAAVEAGIYVHPRIKEALVDLAGETRRHEGCLQGVSTRSLVQILPALQARALLKGRDHVLAEDVTALAGPVFAHRLMLAPGAPPADEVVAACLRRPMDTLARASLRRG